MGRDAAALDGVAFAPILSGVYEIAKELGTEDRAALLMACCEYAFEGTEPELGGLPGAIFKEVAKPGMREPVEDDCEGTPSMWNWAKYCMRLCMHRGIEPDYDKFLRSWELYEDHGWRKSDGSRYKNWHLLANSCIRNRESDR